MESFPGGKPSLSGKGYKVMSPHIPQGRCGKASGTALSAVCKGSVYWRFSLRVLQSCVKSLFSLISSFCSLFGFFLMTAVDQNKMYNLRVKFYLGQNEDCSLTGSISGSSERLLQSSSGGRLIQV